MKKDVNPIFDNQPEKRYSVQPHVSINQSHELLIEREQTGHLSLRNAVDDSINSLMIQKNRKLKPSEKLTLPETVDDPTSKDSSKTNKRPIPVIRNFDAKKMLKIKARFIAKLSSINNKNKKAQDEQKR